LALIFSILPSSSSLVLFGQVKVIFSEPINSADLSLIPGIVLAQENIGVKRPIDKIGASNKRFISISNIYQLTKNL